MKTALFTNFSTEPFTGFWDGKPKNFMPGASMYMPDYLAKHFAKHLTNRELLKVGKERSTSPKKPNDVPEFMEMFNKAYQEDTEKIDAPVKDSVDVAIEVANRNRRGNQSAPVPDNAKAPGVQIADLPVDDDSDEDEASFGGKPVDPESNGPEAGK